MSEAASILRFTLVFNPFLGLGTLWEEEVRPGLWLRLTLPPEYYPLNWWWECECGSRPGTTPR